MLSEQAPDIKLCVSTNGLSLPEHIDELAKYNIDHVTIHHQLRRSRCGCADLSVDLLEEQAHQGTRGCRHPNRTATEGLEMLVAKGILVK